MPNVGGVLGIAVLVVWFGGLAIVLLRRSRADKRPLFPPGARPPAPRAAAYLGPRQIPAKSAFATETNVPPTPPPPPRLHGRDVYAAAFRSACEPGYITRSGWDRLDDLADDLRITAGERAVVEEGPRREALARQVASMLETDIFSPDAASALEHWMKEMRCKPSDLDSDQTTEMQHLATAWRLTHDPIRIVDVPIALTKGEMCYVSTSAMWSELREVSYGVRAGSTVRIPLGAGLSFRVAGYKRIAFNSSALRMIDHGELYITNRRIILTGTTKNFSVRLSSVLKVTPAGDGIIVDKASGRSPHLQLFGLDPLHVAIVTRRLVAEANA